MRCQKKSNTEPTDGLPPALRDIADEPVATAIPTRKPGQERTWETMPFGKHRGERIEDLETSYLHWCVENLEKRTNGLYEALETELWNRSDRR